MDKNEEEVLSEEIPIFEGEVSTADAPPISEDDAVKAPTQCFNRIEMKKKRRGVRSFFRALCLAVLLLTLILSATDVMDFVMDDLGTENMLIRRIFGYGAIKDKESKKLSDMILEFVFFDLSQTPSPAPPNQSPTPSTPLETPMEHPPVTSPQTPPETTPPESPPPETTPSETPPETEGGDTPPDPPDSYPIVSMDLSLLSYGEYYIYNDTSLSPDLKRLMTAKLPSYYSEVSAEPLVLVIHSHATESFMEVGATHYTDEGELARSGDADKNMISVGAEFVKVLVENGIPTLHCVVLHDEESYRLSYQRSAESIERYLKEYPSIKYVFDLHRDSILRSNGELVSAVSIQSGEKCGQIMPVVGSGFEGYEENLALALQLRQRLNGTYVNLCRPVCLRESTYNHNLSPVSLLLEMGTSGNTLDDAKRSAALVAAELAKIIKDQ